MGKLTKEVFPESCCDGGSCSDNKMSAQPCGCDPSMRHNGKIIGYLCDYHRRIKEEAEDDGA